MAHTSDMDLKVKVEIDASSLGKVIADAIEEHMALPACDRQHVEPMAEWEKDLLHAVTFPRVVKSRGEFRPRQLVAFTLNSCEFIGRVSVAKNDGEVKVHGRFLGAADGPIDTAVYNSEIERGQWVILANPQEGAR